MDVICTIDNMCTLVCMNRYQNQSSLDSEGRTLITYAIERHAVNCMKVLLKT